VANKAMSNLTSGEIKSTSPEDPRTKKAARSNSSRNIHENSTLG